MDAQSLAYIVLGTVFLFFGLTACAIAAIRQRTEVRILIWLGIWSGMYGTSMLARVPAVIAVLPRIVQDGAPFVTNAIRYLLVVFALLSWSELTVGKMRQFTRMMVVPGLAISVAGIGVFLVTGSGDELLAYNNLLAVFIILVLAIVVAVPTLASRFLVFPNRILAASTLLFATDALYRNLSVGLHLLPNLSLPMVDELIFASLLFSFAYVAAQKVFSNERRLVSIESELEIARQIQSSILPTGTPEVKNLRIAASYQPTSAVGGDFYEFIQTDEHSVGLLVADVSGHGIPAALIASMIKIAVQSVVSCAQDPAEVLRRLNQILFGQLRGQLVSAAYLWIDTETGEGSYSAAGHPPLLCWREGALKRIESNGLLLGVIPDADYPVCPIRLHQGARFLLYTDGIVEPENAAGQCFGDLKFEQLVRSNQALSPVEFSRRLLSEVGKWQPISVAQQDDITLLVVDIL